MIARASGAWLGWAQRVGEVQRNERDGIGGLLGGVVFFLGLAGLGRIHDGSGRAFMPDPWAGLLIGVTTAIVFPLWCRRIQRGVAGTTEAGIAILFVQVGLQAALLLLADAAHGVFLYGVALVYVFTATAQAWRVRSTLRWPFPLLALVLSLGLGAALAPSEEHLILYGLLSAWLPIASVLLGSFATSGDEARQREAALRAENAALLVEMKHREVARLEALLDQMAGRSHDLGGPVLALDLALERAEAALDEGADIARTRELLQRASAHARALRAMVQRAKEELRAVALPAEEVVGVAEVARVTLEGARLRFPTVRFDAVGDADLAVSVRGGREALARVIENLAANAGEAVSHGATRLEVRVSWAPAGDRARILVEDAGPGFGATRAPTGTGVGLLSVHRIVETSGGTIELGRSEALGGASVIVELPAG